MILILLAPLVAAPTGEFTHGSFRLQSVKLPGAITDVFTADGGCRAHVLVLPGWNFPRADWYQRTDILAQAQDRGFCLYFPETGKTLYESEYFTQTAAKTFAVPAQQWFKTVFFPALQKRYQAFLPGGKNFVLGLSTGGRGAVLLALAQPDIFLAAAALSGDFNQALMKSDRLMTAVYGPYEKYSTRWQTVDNPYAAAPQWKLSLYLGHGLQDKVVPPEQTMLFYQKLMSLRRNLDIRKNFSARHSHDYNYWKSEVKPVFDFFKRHL